MLAQRPDDFAHRHYVATNRRVILFEGGWRIAIRSIHPERLGQIETRQTGNGSGDVILAMELQGYSGKGYPIYREVALYGIPDVEHVKDLVEALRSQKATREA